MDVNAQECIWFIACVIATVVVLLLLYYVWGKHHASGRKVIEALNRCYIKAAPGAKIDWLKGEGYCPEKNGRKPQGCVMTGWSLAHVLLWYVAGVALPRLWWASWITGVAFEFFEYAAYDCHDVLDILWNSAGLMLGLLTRIAIWQIR
jgi:hypothetical protein